MNTKNNTWKPIISCDVETVDRRGLETHLEQFWHVAENRKLEPHGLKDGWHDITPQIAEGLLRRNQPGANRRISLPTVRYYARQMKAGAWQRTGQPILISDKDALLDSQHRLMAGYLSGVTFPSYVVTNVPHVANIFAYIDNGKSRTLTDALQTAGVNGVASKVVQAVKIATEYDTNCYHVDHDDKPLKPTPIEVLDFVLANPGLVEAAKSQLSRHKDANELIKNNGLAVFVAWKITSNYGEDVLENFMEELVDESSDNSSIIQLRKALMKDLETKEMRKSIKLGYITVVFNAWRSNQVLPKLKLATNEPWPRFEDDSKAIAAE